MKKYFKRKWNETRGDEYDAWGTAVFYFEVGENYFPIRQIELYENGNRLKYYSANKSDERGGLSDQALDLNEFQGSEIKQGEFEAEWNKNDTSIHTRK